MQGKNNFLTLSEKNRLEELAEYIAGYYCPNSIISPELIATKLGISFSYGKYGDSFDGLLEHEQDKFHIYINKDRLSSPDSLRARFTFAHELGHYYIDHHRNALSEGLINSHCSLTGFVSDNKMEREADYFAVCLLIPKERLIKYCLRKSFSISLLKELCNEFQVSITSMALRFATIGNHPIMVVSAINKKIIWFWHSNDFPFWNLKYDKENVPENTAMNEYFTDGVTYESKEDVYAQDWFKIKSEKDYDRLFYEFCFYGNNQSILSIIWEG